MIDHRTKPTWTIGLAACLALTWLAGCSRQPDASVFESPVTQAGGAEISPDYQHVTIPPNIAPLNFKVISPARQYALRVRSTQGSPIVVSSRTGCMRIPIQAWRTLLAANKGQTLFFDLALQQEDGAWRRCESISNTISDQPIDRMVAYRLLKPQYNYFRDIGVYQRDLEGFGQSLILHGRSFENGCLNCHTFGNRDPQRMALSIRSSQYGNSCLCIEAGQVTKIGTKFGHTTWHPSGKVIAYSMFDVRMFFHTARPEVHDVVEMDSMLAYYRVDRRKVKTAPVLSDPARLETQPSWGPDGKALYFASGPKLWTDVKRIPPDRFAELKYDIQRVPYDVNTDTWGSIETVVSSAQVEGKSCLLPRVSPDGRFLLFTACDYGCFAIYQPSSDLYLKDLQSGEIRRLECNSDVADTWHAWSTNSRWVVFASKSPTGQFTRLYLSSIDDQGRASRPLVVPQEDPEFYESFLYAYNVPELISGPVTIDPRRLAEAVRSTKAVQVDALTAATVKADPYKETLGQR